MGNQFVLDTITQTIAREARDGLGDKLDKVILYGSYARGDNDDESDIDIIVLANISAEEIHLVDVNLTKLANRLGYEHDVLISLFVKDCETFYKFLPVEPFYQNVLKDGVLLSA